jgi:OHCU decarboxylase
MLSDLPITVYGVATALARAPQQVAAMKSSGWEIASHGLKWVEHKDMGEEEERTQIADAIRLHTEVVGEAPQGWYTGRCSNNTVRLTAETGQFAYVADSYADDLPYWSKEGGVDQLIVPYTMDCNDMRFGIQAGFTNGDQFESYLKDSFDFLYEEGEAGVPKMLSIGLHCRIMGRPGRAAALRRVIEYMKSHKGVWFATRLEIAQHWAKENPAMTTAPASQMTREKFVSEFGGIFEHSAWIAEGAFDLELGPTHDNAQGVHQALARVFRSATEEQRLGVLTAHPDLAGKLAAAKRLTAESTAEQAAAGLNALTAEEHASFTDLNNAYTTKFGFPFIIAVRDNTKTTIMAAFKRRISNDRDVEFSEACKQVERIAELRLIEKFEA